MYDNAVNDSSNLPKSKTQDTVILHCIGRGKTLPNLSPYVLKLETYLRMAKIPYTIDTKKPFGPTGKMPWIELNGQTMSDSQLIIEYLNKKLSKSLWGNATPEAIAMATATRVMMEEHCSWGLMHYRWIQRIDTLPSLMAESALKMWVIKLIMPGRMKKTLHAQGLGRLEYKDMVHLVESDLRSLSTMIGTKDFFLGNEPTEVDCALFGILAQIIYAMPGSPYEKLLNDELTNLKGYCMRMREKYWEDWDECIYKEPEPKK